MKKSSGQLNEDHELHFESFSYLVRMFIAFPVVVSPLTGGNSREDVERRRDLTIRWRAHVTEHHHGEKHRDCRQQGKLDQADHVPSHLRGEIMSRGKVEPAPLSISHENLTSLLGPDFTVR